MKLRAPLTAIAFTATLALLGACGDSASDKMPAADDAASDTPTVPSSDLPACSDVWQEGADLPKKYKGCSVDGEAVETERVSCSSGQRIYLYDDHYWAVRGHVISFAEDGLTEDAKYTDVMYSCRA